MKRVAIALTLLAASCGPEEPAKPAGMSGGPAASTDRVKDVICGMMVDRAASKKVVHDGTPYWFCGDECARKFEAEPKKYAVNCSCGKTSKACPCEHCGRHHDACDCGK